MTNVPPSRMFSTWDRSCCTCVPDFQACGMRPWASAEYPGTLSYFISMPGESTSLS